MPNTSHVQVILLLFVPTIAWVTILHTPALEAQDAKIREAQKELDLSGVGHLTYSPNSKFVAGVTSGPGSLVKIWAIKEKELLHQFRVPGKAHAVAFTPDSSTVVAADGAGNLAWTSTIRAWDLSEGKERKVGTCIGQIGELCFSPDGVQLAAVVKLGYFDMAALKETEIACACQIKVWRVTDEGNVLSINITHPLGEWVELWPPIEGPEWSKRIDEAVRTLVPTRLRFSSDGKRLISETDAGFRTIYDSQTGRTLRHSNTSSVGAFMSMLMIALHEVPADVPEFTVDLPQSGSPMLISRRADGWWQASRKEKVQKDVFKVDGKSYVAIEGGVEKKEDILTMLGLKEDTNLAELVSFEHPLGVIKIARKKASLEFRLEEQKDGMATGKRLQVCEVRWAASDDSAELHERDAERQDAIPWQDFSAAKLEKLRGKNKPILVFCRAEWDLTCSILDRTLFTDRRVTDAIKQLEYIPLVADCTNPSEEIKGFLREVAGWHGNATIVVFRGPKNEDPVVLQVKSSLKLISAEDLLDAMKPRGKAKQ